MRKSVKYYDLERVISRTKRDFGTIKRGTEDDYYSELYILEKNLLSLYQKNRKLTGHDLRESIQIALLTINGYLSDIDYDFSAVFNEKNVVLTETLLMSFDPFSRTEIMDRIKDNYSLDTIKARKEYFARPVRCLLRIEQSIALWTEEWGTHGYFEYIEHHLDQIAGLENVHFFIPVKIN